MDMPPNGSRYRRLEGRDSLTKRTKLIAMKIAKKRGESSRPRARRVGCGFWNANRIAEQ